MAKATEYPSSIFGTAARAFKLLECEGVNVPAFLQLIISDPKIRAKVAQAAVQPKWIPMPKDPSSEAVESLLRATFGWRRNWPMTDNQQTDFVYYMHTGIRELTSQLDERQVTVLVLRFGLSGMTPMTLLEAGDYLKLSKERIRQVESKALYKLREADHRRKNELARLGRLNSEGYTPIEDLDLSERPRNCLALAKINAVEELEHKTADDLLAITNFDTKALAEVVAALDRIGRHLATAE